MSPLQPFRIEHAVSGRRQVLMLSGELDMAASTQLEATLASLPGDGVSELTVDLSRLTFMDSAGLHTVLNARAFCVSHGAEFSLVGGPPNIQRLFEITGLLDVMGFATNGAGGQPHRSTRLPPHPRNTRRGEYTGST
jgi:anti-anti-sigma factor